MDTITEIATGLPSDPVSGGYYVAIVAMGLVGVVVTLILRTKWKPVNGVAKTEVVNTNTKNIDAIFKTLGDIRERIAKLEERTKND